MRKVDGPAGRSVERGARLRQALRANLRRRKASHLDPTPDDEASDAAQAAASDETPPR